MPSDTAAGYTPVEREAIETAGAAGGVVAYIRRLSDGHRFTFYKRGDGSLGVGSCTCGDILCKGPYIALHRAELIASYEAKVQDLARETLRTSLFAKVMRRLYTMSGWGKDAGYHEHQIRRFFRNGFPPDELEALLSVLDPAEVEWINA